MIDLQIHSVARFIYHTKCAYKSHSHSEYEIMVYLGGEGDIAVNGVTYAYTSDHVAFIPPNTPHRKSLNTDSGELISIRFSCENMEYAIPYPVIRLQDTEEFHHTTRLLYKEMRAHLPLYTAKARAHLESLLIMLARENAMPSSYSRSKLESIYDYICQNCTQKINLTRLAADSNMSYDHFRHIFYKTFGISPQALLIEQRFCCAKRMLENNNEPITHIALTCGFSDASQFSHMFRQRYGITPRQYRKEYWENPVQSIEKEVKSK